MLEREKKQKKRGCAVWRALRAAGASKKKNKQTNKKTEHMPG